MNIRSIVFLIAGILFIHTVQAQSVADTTFKRTPKGALYHIISTGSGDKIKLNDVITFNVVQKTSKDSVLFSSYASGNPVKIQVQPSQNIGDLMDIFPLLGVKDSAVVKIPADSVFIGHEEQRPPFLPKGSYLVFSLKVERVQSLADAIAERNVQIEKVKSAETSAIQTYVSDKKLVFKTTPSGLKYLVTRPSIKRKPLSGDTVYVNYTGSTLGGKVFDSSVEAAAKTAGLEQPGRTYEPLKVVVGHGEVIKGWDEGLLLLNEGSKATLLIPSALAYGEQGAGNDIKPFSPLVFDMEVVKIKPVHHALVKPALKKKAVKKPVKKPAAANKAQ